MAFWDTGAMSEYTFVPILLGCSIFQPACSHVPHRCAVARRPRERYPAEHRLAHVLSGWSPSKATRASSTSRSSSAAVSVLPHALISFPYGDAYLRWTPPVGPHLFSFSYAELLSGRVYLQIVSSHTKPETCTCPLVYVIAIADTLDLWIQK